MFSAKKRQGRSKKKRFFWEGIFAHRGTLFKQRGLYPWEFHFPYFTKEESRPKTGTLGPCGAGGGPSKKTVTVELGSGLQSWVRRLGKKKKKKKKGSGLLRETNWSLVCRGEGCGGKKHHLGHHSIWGNYWGGGKIEGGGGGGRLGPSVGTEFNSAGAQGVGGGGGETIFFFFEKTGPGKHTREFFYTQTKKKAPGGGGTHPANFLQARDYFSTFKTGVACRTKRGGLGEKSSDWKKKKKNNRLWVCFTKTNLPSGTAEEGW